MKHVCVIGAGIVGCSTAYMLAKEGYQVTLIEEQDAPGTLTSFANGAQLSYNYVEPFASPATLRSLPSLLLDARSPFRLRLRADWRQWAWCMQFLKACTSTQVRAGTEALLTLSAISRETLATWIAEDNLPFGYKKNGKLVLCPDKPSFDKQRKQVAFQKTLGCNQQILGAAECIDLEPALAGYHSQFIGGVWTESESMGDCHALCVALDHALTQLGSNRKFGTRVTGFDVQSNKIRAIQTSAGDIEADLFVLATGVHAPVMASKLGIYLPIYPIKGYSLTLPLINPDKAPSTSITDLGKKTVFTTLNGQLRVAAMAELTGFELDIPAARINTMVQSVNDLFPDACDTSRFTAWAGLRPSTPTSVPMVQKSKIQNLLLNVGHGALGFTLAPGCARIIHELIRNEPC